MSGYPDCGAIFMDSHLPVYRRYIDMERQYDFETHDLPQLRRYEQQDHVREWHGKREQMHPGRVVVRQYTNLILNYVCKLNQEKSKTD